MPFTRCSFHRYTCSTAILEKRRHIADGRKAQLLTNCNTSRQAIIKQFPDIDLRALTSVEQTNAELQGLERQSTRLCLGVGCIPSVQPVTDGEKMVYDVARAIFSYSYAPGDNIREESSKEEQYFALPQKAIFFDMAYKVRMSRRWCDAILTNGCMLFFQPVMTLLRLMAEEAGWRTGSGVDIVAENCVRRILAVQNHSY